MVSKFKMDELAREKLEEDKMDFIVEKREQWIEMNMDYLLKEFCDDKRDEFNDFCEYMYEEVVK